MLIRRLSLLQLVFAFDYSKVRSRSCLGFHVGARGSCRAFVVAMLGASSSFLPSADRLDLGMSAAINPKPSLLFDLFIRRRERGSLYAYLDLCASMHKAFFQNHIPTQGRPLLLSPESTPRYNEKTLGHIGPVREPVWPIVLLRPQLPEQYDIDRIGSARSRRPSHCIKSSLRQMAQTQNWKEALSSEQHCANQKRANLYNYLENAK